LPKDTIEKNKEKTTQTKEIKVSMSNERKKKCKRETELSRLLRVFLLMNSKEQGCPMPVSVLDL
jgi:hypothetical protein